MVSVKSLLVCASPHELNRRSASTSTRWNVSNTIPSLHVGRKPSCCRFMLIAILGFAGASLPATSLRAELLTNGDFELGNAGFTTDYQYVPADGTTPGNYMVISNPNTWFWYFADQGDHTTGSGLMMTVNGSTIADKLVWGETINVSPNTLYSFSSWTMSCYGESQAQLDVVLNGATLLSYDAPAESGVWQQHAVQWNSASATSLSIQIYDRNLSFGGSDFALDDISLSAVPEPSSLACFGIGAICLLAHSVARRRSRMASLKLKGEAGGA